MNENELDLAKFEGKRAKGYDGFVQQWIPNYDYFMSIFPKILADVSKKNMLAVGCGTGNELISLKEFDPGWSITGVDPSPEMIQIAKKKLSPYDGIELINGQIGQLNTKLRFGAASLILVLHFIKYPNEKLALLHQIRQRLLPGATFVIMGILGNRDQLKGNLDILKAILPNHLPEKEVSERIERITHKLFRTTEEELEKLLVKSGFESPTRFFQASIYSGWVTKKL
ncbi:MAG: class I SAM-dependent methyltransferase [Allomuricauda sp.]|nr:MAG: class I SAM-dependent methyltransferase [Allomuricauda sp.]